MNVDIDLTIEDDLLAEVLDVGLLESDWVMSYQPDAGRKALEGRAVLETYEDRVELNRAKVANGLREAAKQSPWVLGAVLKDGGDIQEEAAERFLQLCLFGRVRYGV